MGKPPNLFSFSNDEDLARNLRAFVVDAQNNALQREKHNHFRVAVSGGSLPKTLAKALLEKGNGGPNDTVEWDKWQIFFADERLVPLDHEDSNYKLVKEELLDKISETPEVITLNTSLLDDPEEAADDYQQKILERFAQGDSVKLPMFDLLLLGCGPDGHTCSLFPGSPLLREKDAWVLYITDSPKPPPTRITLSLPVVTHAVKIGFVATGAGKKDVLRQIFDTEEGQQLPCGLVNNDAAGTVAWFTDASAVDGVQFPSRRGSL